LEFSKLLTNTAGLPPEFASMLASMEADVAAGGEERPSNAVKEVTGNAPQRFEDFAIREKEHWM
jgi:hypothetical protein